MLTRKYETECSDGVLTVHTVKSGLSGWRIPFFVMLTVVAIAMFDIWYSVRDLFSHTIHHDNGMIAQTFWLLLPVNYYFAYFSAWRFSFDAKNDRLVTGSRFFSAFRKVKLSDVTQARVERIILFGTPPPGSRGMRHLVLETKSGRKVVIHITYSWGDSEDAQLIEIARRINEFLADPAAAERRGRSLVEAWSVGTKAPA